MLLTLRKKKPQSQSDKILAALKKAGAFGLWNYELSKICLSWHRRIGDLRKEGVNIQSVRQISGGWKYYLNEEK